MALALDLMTAGVDRRSRSVRHDIGCDVVFASETQELTGATCDVSLDGACLAAYRLVPVRTPLRVRLALPQGVVYASAVVRWVRAGRSGGPGTLGLEWTELSELDRSLLARFDADAAGACASERRPGRARGAGSDVRRVARVASVGGFVISSCRALRPAR
jgi:hypothetical protein